VGLKDHAIFFQCDFANRNLSEFIQWHAFLPQSWNDGILEQWNNGFSKEIIHFKLYRQNEFPYIAVSQDPFIQYSSIPVKARPLTFDKRIQWVQL